MAKGYSIQYTQKYPCRFVKNFLLTWYVDGCILSIIPQGTRKESKMKLRTLLNGCGCCLVEVMENNDKENVTVAIIDYMFMGNQIDGIYFPTKLHLSDELLDRRIDFFTAGKSFGHDGRYNESVRVYLK